MLTGCIGASTNFTNRSVTYQLTPSIDGKANTINEQPKVGDGVVNAEKQTDISTDVKAAKELTETKPVETKPTVEEQK